MAKITKVLAEELVAAKRGTIKSLVKTLCAEAEPYDVPLSCIISAVATVDCKKPGKREFDLDKKELAAVLSSEEPRVSGWLLDDLKVIVDLHMFRGYVIEAAETLAQIDNILGL